MVIAQALGEYVGVSSIISAMSELWSSVTYYLSDIQPRTWVIGGIVLFVVAFLWTRGR